MCIKLKGKLEAIDCRDGVVLRRLGSGGVAGNMAATSAMLLAVCSRNIIEMAKIALYALDRLCYPKRCFHCDEVVSGAGFLCEGCQPLLEPLPADGIGDEASCRTGSPLMGLWAAFPYEGPAASAVKALKFGGMPFLAQGMGAWMAHSYLSSGRPPPDVIVPVPLSAAHLLQRGYNQSALLAESFGAVVGRPVRQVLGRYSGAYAQMNLPSQERQRLDEGWFALVDPLDQGLSILLIDDVITTGATLRCCARLLQGLSPRAVYAMAFAKALRR